MGSLPLALADPLWLLLLPLAVLPLLRRDVDTVNYSWLALVPPDPLSTALGWLLRAVAAAVIAAIVLGLAGLHRPQVPVERVGKGAEIVMLLDRSGSMDESLQPRAVGGPAQMFGAPQDVDDNAESKGILARRLLAEFAAKRQEDLVGLVLFSTAPIPVMYFTQNQAMIQSAIKAGGVGRGLSDTDIGRGLLKAASFFDGRAYAGSRLILMVSDGAAEINPTMKERLAQALRRNRIGLYWIYIRSSGSPSLREQPNEPEKAATSAERVLHKYFEEIGVPYRAYEAEDPDALKRAISDVGRLENLPIHYQEMLPRMDLANGCYVLAAGGCLLLFAAAMMRIRRWT